uniref:Disease resistance protein winged helix domain-containing protein n=1 Tax=Arundo donax TaxID=35708 RepID=A0A0A9C245_ARUDO
MHRCQIHGAGVSPEAVLPLLLLYPEGSMIEQKNIVQQWTAEDFFEGRESTGGQQGTCPPLDLEKEARECYTELVNRSLLVRMIDGADGCATMPTLLRSYAIYRSQYENYVGDPCHIGRAFKVWRLCAADADTIHDIPDDITSLTTLLVFGSSSPRRDTGPSTTPAVINVICQKFTSLRVLDLRDTQVEVVGSNLGRLLQFRYLNLSHTRIKNFPWRSGILRCFSS